MTTCTPCGVAPVPQLPGWPALVTGRSCPPGFYLDGRVKRTTCDSVTGWAAIPGGALTYLDCVPCTQCTTGSGGMIDSIDIQCPPFNFFYSTKTPAGNKTCSATAACESIYVPGTTPKYTNPKAFNNDGGFWPPSANLSAYCVYTHDAHLPGYGGNPNMPSSPSMGPFVFVAGYFRVPGAWGFFRPGTDAATQGGYVPDVLPYYRECDNSTVMQIPNSIENTNLTADALSLLNGHTWAWEDDCQPFLIRQCAANNWATTQHSAAKPGLPYLVACTPCPADSQAPAGFAAACTCNAGFASASELWGALALTRRCDDGSIPSLVLVDIIHSLEGAEDTGYCHSCLNVGIQCPSDGADYVKAVVMCPGSGVAPRSPPSCPL